MAPRRPLRRRRPPAPAAANDSGPAAAARRRFAVPANDNRNRHAALRRYLAWGALAAAVGAAALLYG